MPLLILLIACTSDLPRQEAAHFPPSDACLHARASIERALCGQLAESDPVRNERFVEAQ